MTSVGIDSTTQSLLHRIKRTLPIRRKKDCFFVLDDATHCGKTNGAPDISILARDATPHLHFS